MLSVIIPVHNRHQQTQSIIEVLSFQAKKSLSKELEVVVIDDGSTPKLKLKSQRGLAISLIRNEERMGANAARERGLRASRGHFVNFHDSDDGFDNDWLAEIIKALHSTKHCPDIVVTRRWNETGGRRYLRAQRWVENNHLRPTAIRQMLLLRNCLGPYGGIIFSRVILDSINLPNAASSQDWLVYLQAFDNKPTVAIAPHARFVHRLDGNDRISTNSRAKVLGMFAIIKATKKKHFCAAGARYIHLNTFARWIHLYHRNSLTRILRKTSVLRIFWGTAAFVFSIIALRLV